MLRLQAALTALPPLKDDVARYTAMALMHGYHSRWHNEHPWKTAIDEEGQPFVERVFQLNIHNPKTGRKSQRYSHAGKFDAIAHGPPGLVLVEHKTVSESISQDSPYWKRLVIDTQITSYILAAWQMGTQLENCLYDVIRKPCIEPKKVAMREQHEVMNYGSYLGVKIDPTTYHHFSLDPEKREQPEMFGIRLRKDCEERPDWYFQRKLIHRPQDELKMYAHELWEMTKEIADATKRQHFRRNDRSCFAYNRPCEYLDLCTGYAGPDQFQRTDQVHVELGLGKLSGVLTHSAIGTYAACPKKYAYRYAEGLIANTEAEPLTLGSAIHQALAAWWSTHEPGEDRRQDRQQEAA